MVHIYIDTEFDAVRIDDHFEQSVISIGAVLLNEQFTECARFYQLVKPRGFSHLTPVVRRMTKLKDKDILAAPSLKESMIRFRSWIEEFSSGSSFCMYVFGPDDQRTLLANCRSMHLDGELFSSMTDLQKLLSAQVYWQGALFSSALSLDDLKTIYEIEGEVEHNALTDALDLMRLHQAVRNGKQPSADALAILAKKREEKRLLQAKRRCAQLEDAMKKQLSFSAEEWRVLKKSEEVKQLLRRQQEKRSSFPFQLEQDVLIVQKQTFSFWRCTILVRAEKEKERWWLLFLLKQENTRIQVRVPLSMVLLPLLKETLDEELSA